MIITITEVGEATQESKGKRQWSNLTIKYNGEQGDKERTFRSFGPDWKIAKTLENGKTYDVKLRKDGSFWVWESATETTPGAKASSSGVLPTSQWIKQSGYWNDRTSLDKERFEFDKEKQALIVRQSSLATAVNYVVSASKDCTVEEVIAVAKQFEEYVFSKGDLTQMEVE